MRYPGSRGRRRSGDPRRKWEEMGEREREREREEREREGERKVLLLFAK